MVGWATRDQFPQRIIFRILFQCGKLFPLYSTKKRYAKIPEDLQKVKWESCNCKTSSLQLLGRWKLCPVVGLIRTYKTQERRLAASTHFLKKKLFQSKYRNILQYRSVRAAAIAPALKFLKSLIEKTCKYLFFSF
jgi:hypothetical protein